LSGRTGLQPSPSNEVTVSGGRDFQWGNAGIGAGIVAALLLGTGGVLVVRGRRQGGLAH